MRISGSAACGQGHWTRGGEEAKAVAPGAVYLRQSGWLGGQVPKRGALGRLRPPVGRGWRLRRLSQADPT